MGDHLLYCNPRVCGLGDHVLSEPNKAQVRELPESTQHEFGVKASQEVRFSKTVNVGHFFSTRPECDAHGRSTAPYCKDFTTPRSNERSMIIRNIPGRTTNWSRATHFRLRGSRVSPPLHGTAWRRICRGVLQCGHVNRQNSHQRSKERSPSFDKRRKTQSRRPSSKIRICASGDRLRIILESHRHQNPTDCAQASQIPPDRASGDRWLSNHHQRTEKTHRNHLKFTLVKDVGM